MSRKTRLAGFALALTGMMEAKDNKGRLPFLIAKVENGKVMDSKGNVYCEDFEGEDVVFVTEEDLKLTRVTGTKIAGIKLAITDYFGDNEESTEDAETEESTEDAETEDVKEVIAGGEDTSIEDNKETEEKPEIDVDAVTEAFSEAIENGKLKKAIKLLDKLIEAGVKTKKLEKKLKKASK
ncbi:hypothetical protein KY321_01390 [Candidatus Woesearchaeota archaeon]|nr:hypothetical protein [Candidatus Woesearchaeota archaeon]